MAARPSASPSRPLVAIVDDDASVGRAVTRLARHMGMDAQAFESGRDLLDRLDATPPMRPDCVVLDVQLPGLSGLDIQDRLRQRHVGCGIVMMTAFQDPADRQRALTRGASVVLLKPFDEQAFAAAVREALATRRGRTG